VTVKKMKPFGNCLLLISLVALLFGVPRSWAQESITEDRPAPDSVQGLRTPMESGFEIEKVKPPRLPRLKKKLEDLPPFFRDTKLLLKTRSFFFRRDNLDGSENEAWALGGSVAYESGWFMDRLKVGAEFFTSQKLHAPLGKDGTGLLAPRQHHYNVLGQAYALIKITENHKLSLYRQAYDLPYVNKSDSRMTPNTFEGYSLQGRFDRRGKRPKIEYIGGYIAKMKKRNSDTFVPIGEASGAADEPNRGMIMAGVRISPTENFSLGAINYFIDDVLNIFYTEGNYTWSVSDDLALRFKGQFTDQRSVGDDLLKGSSFDTQVGGAEAAVSYRAGILRAAFSSTSEEAGVVSPFGSYPGYLSLMVNDFDRAGEDAWLVGFSYDFKRIGLEGLSAFANLAAGCGARDAATGLSLPDQKELDVTVDYRMPEGRFRGFWIRLRGGFVDQKVTGDSVEEYRVIVNYEIPLL
jgi:hypothetical protein